MGNRSFAFRGLRVLGGPLAVGLLGFAAVAGLATAHQAAGGGSAQEAGQETAEQAAGSQDPAVSDAAGQEAAAGAAATEESAPDVLLPPEPKLGDVADGSRADHIHILDLRDDTGSLIYPDDPVAQPFSPRQTCQECHDYGLISGGWHFNAADPEVGAGRRGEPWVLVDHLSATQVPLSHRSWPGTSQPEDFGLSPFPFTETFGRHLPGGGVSEAESDEPLDVYVRWLVSGKAEVNCLSCHDLEAGHDQAEYDRQIRQQNFRWAAAATSAFATVTGSAKEMPDNYDVYSGGTPGPTSAPPPTVEYDPTRFNQQGKVLFEVPRRAPADRCYFCHSSVTISEAREERWQADQDVHMAAGLTCVDCHRNGLDHQIVRGYEWEAEDRGAPAVSALTCAGCHIRDPDDEVPASGSLGAPNPAHRGLPVVHFDRLACTACHSGPWPSQEAQRVKLSRTHALGTHGVRKGDHVAPYVLSPVYVRDDDGKIAPHRLIWPSFWGFMTERTTTQVSDIEPAPLQEVRAAVLAAVLAEEPEGGPNVSRMQAGSWPLFSEAQMLRILEDLAAEHPERGTPVFVGGGKVFRLAAAGLSIEEDHPAARPYSWALAHNVRPAGQSLGIRGCDDCHALGAPFSFGTVSAPVPFEFADGATIRMTRLQGVGAAYSRVFALSFLFRPLVKYTILICCVIMLLVIFFYTLRSLELLLRAGATGESGSSDG